MRYIPRTIDRIIASPAVRAYLATRAALRAEEARRWEGRTPPDQGPRPHSPAGRTAVAAWSAALQSVSQAALLAASLGRATEVYTLGALLETAAGQLEDRERTCAEDTTPEAWHVMLLAVRVVAGGPPLEASASGQVALPPWSASPELLDAVRGALQRAERQARRAAVPA